MSTAEVETAPPAPALPDYLLNPNAVLQDPSKWRYGRAPDYSNTRTAFEDTKKMSHEAASLPSLVQNLVKNWEIEASFKPELSDWRTIDHGNYSFAINGGPPQDAQHMLKVGTYNAIIAPNEFYSPANSDFASSHKTFKRMMPTFAWEVVEVYSGPPVVAFKWRHWGQMKNDYVGFNDKGEKITAKAHQGTIDIEGITVAHVDEQVRLQKVETWFDPLEMFRQIAPDGIVNKSVRSPSDDQDDGHSDSESTPAPEPSKEESNTETTTATTTATSEKSQPETKQQDEELKQPNPNPDPAKAIPDQNDPIPEFPQKLSLAEQQTPPPPSSSQTPPPPSSSNANEPPPSSSSFSSPPTADHPPSSSTVAPLNPPVDLPYPSSSIPTPPPPNNTHNSAQATAPTSAETARVHEEMSRISSGECPFMNRE